MIAYETAVTAASKVRPPLRRGEAAAALLSWLGVVGALVACVAAQVHGAPPDADMQALIDGLTEVTNTVQGGTHHEPLVWDATRAVPR